MNTHADSSSKITMNPVFKSSDGTVIYRDDDGRLHVYCCEYIREAGNFDYNDSVKFIYNACSYDGETSYTIINAYRRCEKGAEWEEIGYEDVYIDGGANLRKSFKFNGYEIAKEPAIDAFDEYFDCVKKAEAQYEETDFYKENFKAFKVDANTFKRDFFWSYEEAISEIKRKARADYIAAICAKTLA